MDQLQGNNLGKQTPRPVRTSSPAANTTKTKTKEKTYESDDMNKINKELVEKENECRELTKRKQQLEKLLRKKEW